MCPCAPLTLIRAVTKPLRGLVPDIEETREQIEGLLESVIASGDLVECRDVTEPVPGQGPVLVYLAPPSFAVRRSGDLLILGIAADRPTPLPEDLAIRVEYIAHTRRLRRLGDEKLEEELRELGWIELSSNARHAPDRAEGAAEFLSRLDHALDAAMATGDIPGLVLLDSATPVSYYRGRWTENLDRAGRFVGRRKQAYGSDLWCYVALAPGQPSRLLDLPMAPGPNRGCDDAWRLQMAIDFARGKPQQVKVSNGAAGTQIIRFYSPIPMWARRRMDEVGELVFPSGCLFAYRVAKDEAEEELHFLREHLWLRDVHD